MAKKPKAKYALYINRKVPQLTQQAQAMFKGKTFDAGSFDSFPDYIQFVRNVSVPGGTMSRNCNIILAQMADDAEIMPVVHKFEQTRANERYMAPAELTEMAYDVAGDFVDVGRYMSGEPECMCQYDTEQKPAKFLTVNVRTACVGNSFAYYSMILDLLDYLESAGTRCRIFLELNHNSSKKGWRSKGKIRLKDFADPMDIRSFCAYFLSSAMNTWAKASADCFLSKETYGVDGNDISGPVEQPQDPNEITLPSAWFRDYYAMEPEDMNVREYLNELNLGHLLAGPPVR